VFVRDIIQTAHGLSLAPVAMVLAVAALQMLLDPIAVGMEVKV